MNAPHDVDAMLRDDALLDALSRGELPAEFSDDRTAQLLFAWHGDMAEPIAEPEPDPVPAPRRLLWLSRRVSVAAAIGVMAAGSAGSVGAASIAEPGDALWPITRVVYADRAESLEARDAARDTLAEARAAVEDNRPDQAKRLLNEAAQKAGQVREGDERAAIVDEVANALAALEQRPAPATAAPSSGPQSPKPSPTPEPASRPASPTPSADPVMPPTPAMSSATPTRGAPDAPLPSPDTGEPSEP